MFHQPEILRYSFSFGLKLPSNRTNYSKRLGDKSNGLMMAGLTIEFEPPRVSIVFVRNIKTVLSYHTALHIHEYSMIAVCIGFYVNFYGFSARSNASILI